MWETIKKIQHQRIDALESWRWRRLLRVHWIARISNQRKSTLNIHWKDWCWSWSSNILATWHNKQTHWKRSWCWERLRTGRDGVGGRWWDGWMSSLTQWTQIWAYSRRQWRTGKPGVLQFTKNWTQLSDWTTTSSKLFNLVIPQSWCLKRKAFCTQRLLSYLFYISSVYLLFSPCLSLSPSLTFSLSPDIFIYY